MAEYSHIKIAYWYYALGLTQEEIANRLNLTRQKVNRIINSLEEEGIISININGYERENIENEGILEREFGLSQAIIASNYGEEDTALVKVANVAAQYVSETVTNGDVVGVTWGRKLSQMLRNVPYVNKKDCVVIQMLGAQNLGDNINKSDEIARELANHFNCPSYMLYAPIVVENEETKNYLIKERTVRASFDMVAKCKVALMGIGELNRNAFMFKQGFIPGEMLTGLRKEGFCGEICMNPVRIDGSYDHCEFRKRVIGVDMEAIKKIPNVIAMAAGINKAQAILAVLRSGCVNTLIIDEATAAYIIKGLQGKD